MPRKKPVRKKKPITKPINELYKNTPPWQDPDSLPKPQKPFKQKLFNGWEYLIIVFIWPYAVIAAIIEDKSFKGILEYASGAYIRHPNLYVLSKEDGFWGTIIFYVGLIFWVFLSIFLIKLL